jgi:UDP-N-acetyl-D-mannosaminuronate dehydrogenase
MLYIGETRRPLSTTFGEHRCAVIGNDANQPVVRHFNTPNHSASDMSAPILKATIATKDMKCASFPNLVLYLALINERFSYV